MTQGRHFETQFRPEQLERSVYMAEGVIVRGDVAVGRDSSLWFHAVIRGDTEAVSIGAETNIQDACVVHADPGFPCRIGDRVTVGHAAIVHGAQIDDEVMVGMRAVVLNGAKVGTGSIIGAGAVVPEGMVIEPNSLVLGVPARVVRPTTEEQRTLIRRAAAHYVEAARAFARSSSRANSSLGGLS